MAIQPTQQKVWWKIFSPILFMGLIAIAALTLLRSQLKTSPSEQENPQATLNSVIPDFSLTKMDETQIKLSSFNSKLLLVNFWATWCEACVSELPTLISLRDFYQNRGLEIIGINLDENPEKAVPLAIKQFKINFPVFKDPTTKAAEAFNVIAIPLTVILDQNRKILLKENGEQDWNSAEVHSKIDKWLKE